MAPELERPGGAPRSNAPSTSVVSDVVEVRSLVKRYRRGLFRPWRPVLNGVDLTVRAGETVALVGPNGSGKSTLLRILAGIEGFDGGEARVLGSRPDSPPALAGVGTMGDVEALPSELRAGEALQLFGSIAGMKGARLEESVDAALERVGLTAESKTNLGRFSLGMKRRFGLAAATFTEPRLLLLDEPSAGLDAPGHIVLTDLVRAAKARGAAVLFASHQLDDLSSFADRIAVLVDGSLVASGRPEELVDRTGSGRLELDAVSGRSLHAIAEQARRDGALVEATGPGRAALRRIFADAAGPANDTGPEGDKA